jgi:hypothetical protein
MKKLLVVLLALTLFGVFAFAQDAAAAPTVTWNVSAYNGFAIVNDGNSSTTALQPYSYDWEGKGAYRFQMAVNAADGNSGFQFRLQTADQLATAAPTFNEIWAYGKFLNGMVKVEGGLLNDYALATGGWECYGNSDNGKLGAQIDIMPIEGLTIGAYAPITNIDTFANTQIGFGYEMADMFHLAGGYIMSPVTNGGALYAGLVLKAVKDLSFNVEVKLSNLGDSTNGTTNIEEYVAYPFGALTASMYAGEWMYASASSNFYFNFEPQVAYKLSDTATVALIGNVYTVNGGAATGSAAMNFISPTDGLLTNYADQASAVIAFGLGPNVQLKAGGFKVTIGDYYAILPKDGVIPATNVNVFYTGMTYSY